MRVRVSPAALAMLSKREIIALTIWWCEGTKARKDKRWINAQNCPVEITNTDPSIIRIMLEYLRHDMGVASDFIRGRLQLHEGDNQEALERFWSEITKIAPRQMNKTILRPQGKKIGKSKGTFTIRVYDKILYEHMLQTLNREIKLTIGE